MGRIQFFKRKIKNLIENIEDEGIKGMNLAFIRPGAIFVGLVWLGFSFSHATAETAGPLQIKVTDYAVSSMQLPVEDGEGHFIGIGQREGEAVFSNQEKAKYSAVFSFDGLLSKGYAKFAFDDGSWFSMAWSSEMTPEMDGRLSVRGQGTIRKGGGRFKGIMGGAIFSGKELKPASQDPKRSMDTNVTLIYRLP